VRAKTPRGFCTHKEEELCAPEILRDFRAARWLKELFPPPVCALVMETVPADKSSGTIGRRGGLIDTPKL
jgi:hypothetical protein